MPTKMQIATVLGSLGAAFAILAKMLEGGPGAPDVLTGVPLIIAALGPALAVFHAKAAVDAHVDDAHPETNAPGSSASGPTFGDRVKGQGGRARVALLAFLFFVCGVVGCAAIIPASHVKADIARHDTIGVEWARYRHTGYGPDGKTLTAASIAAGDANLAAWDRDDLESAKAAGLVAKDATSVEGVE